MPGKENGNGLFIDTALFTEAAQLYRAVNNSVRRQIIAFIDKERKTAVTPLYKKLKMEQSVASQHLAILRKAGVVHAEREGQQVFYSVNYDRLEELHRAAHALLN